ncbi:MAG: leucyl aminopeptidase [Phototrophicaceae bacterium]
MKITASTGNLIEQAVDALIVYKSQDTDLQNAADEVDKALNGVIRTVIDSGDFTGQVKETLVLYTNGLIPAKRVIVVGLGQSADFTPDTVRQAAAVGVQKAHSLKLNTIATRPISAAKDAISVEDAAQAVTEGVLLGLYYYHGQKSSDAPHVLETLTIVADDEASTRKGITVGTAFAEGTTLARDLINLPPNIANPAYLASQAEKMAKSVGLKCTVLDRPQMQALKMGALLGVAQGSDAPPKFIILEHNPDKKDDGNTVVLIGKGVTFDTGGYSLKTRDGMIGMKADMSGGAAVIGAMHTISQLDVPLHVVGLIPASDNMVSSKAYRPQEVLTASNGTTIEIISTDAEGRLLLADALVYAQRYNPAAVVDIATLTGSISVALGHAMTGVYSNDDDVFAKLNIAANTTHELVWRMPMAAEYGNSLKSDTADTKNSGGRAGGAGVAAHFLSNFVDYHWAHVDMAGMLTNEGLIAYQPQHSARGYGARLLAEFARQWSAS